MKSANAVFHSLLIEATCRSLDKLKQMRFIDLDAEGGAYVREAAGHTDLQCSRSAGPAWEFHFYALQCMAEGGMIHPCQIAHCSGWPC